MKDVRLARGEERREETYRRGMRTIRVSGSVGGNGGRPACQAAHLAYLFVIERFGFVDRRLGCGIV